jgi:hypothetical protein
MPGLLAEVRVGSAVPYMIVPGPVGSPGAISGPTGAPGTGSGGGCGVGGLPGPGSVGGGSPGIGRSGPPGSGMPGFAIGIISASRVPRELEPPPPWFPYSTAPRIRRADAEQAAGKSLLVPRRGSDCRIFDRLGSRYTAASARSDAVRTATSHRLVPWLTGLRPACRRRVVCLGP